MSETLVPLIEQEWRKPPLRSEEMPMMTAVGLIEGEVLTFLEEHGATTMRHLIRELEWPARMIMMATGALIREHLVQATPHELEVLLEPLTEGAPREQRTERSTEV